MCSIVRIVEEKRELLEIIRSADLLGVVVGTWKCSFGSLVTKNGKFNLKSFHQPWLGFSKKKNHS